MTPPPLAPGPQYATLDRLPSVVLRDRLVHLRRSRGLRQDDLVERMNDFGWNWVRSTVAKIELGKRSVTVDELVSLAFVLGVSPVALLTNPEYAQERITPNTVAGATFIWRWMTQRFPLGGGRPGEVVSPDEALDRVAFYNDARPKGIRAAESALPGVTALASYLDAVEESAAGLAYLAIEPAWLELYSRSDLIDRLLDELSLLRHQVNVLVRRVEVERERERREREVAKQKGKQNRERPATSTHRTKGATP